MNLDQMQTELSLIVKDASLQPFLTDWINNAILEVATDFELASLRLIDPEAVTVDTSKWLWPMPLNFHKRLLRAQWVGDDGTQHHIKVHDHISSLEYRDHTQTGDWVTEVAAGVQGGTGGVQTYLGIFPLATQDINLWYYRKPAVLSKATDVCDCIPESFEPRVIYPRVVIRNYKIIVDQVVDFAMNSGSLQYWKGEQMQGDLDLKNFFAKNYNKPRRTGGKDPIGPNRRFFRGYR